MRASIRASLLAVTALLVGSADASAQVWNRTQTQTPPRTGVCFYADINYGGRYFCTNTNTEDPLVEMNDGISSIRVFGNAEVTVYQDRDFQGRSQTFVSDVNDLRRDNWNDTISSVRVQPQGGAGGWANRWGRPATPANGACFYDNVNFTGQYFCSRQGESVQMVPEGTNDRISSIRLFGNAELVVYRDRDFGGVSEWFDVSEPDLRESGWNDTISSYQIGTRGSFGNRGRGNAYGRGAGRGLGYADSRTGSLEWRGWVDNRVQLVIRGRSVQERAVAGNRFDQGRAIFASGYGLPAEAVRVNVRDLTGRGDVRVIQQPSRQNGYTAIVQIYGPTRGAQEHRIQVTWR
ncbi:MAG TPA: peptidase inhibitor family I36 protein [Vicinamibacterales bacterium]|nr:peptidase inhibitor family I36 protein [Vicinamibacterales bacterium]